MNYTPDYKIQLSDGGNIPLLFNSWTFRQYCQKTGIELEELMNRITTGQAFKAKDLPSLLITAAQSFCKFNHKDFAFSEDDADMWVDEMGGWNSAKLVDIYKTFVMKFINISPEKFEVLWKGAEETVKPETEKKKEAEAIS